MDIKKLLNFIIGAALSLVAGILYLLWENKSISLSRYTLSFRTLPAAFNGLTIIHLSDLQSEWFGSEQNRILNRVKKEAPDLVVFTGDAIDHSRQDEAAVLTLIRGLLNICPIYFVTGNHEAAYSGYRFLEQKLKILGVNILRDSPIPYTKNNETLLIAGVDDPHSLDHSLNKADLHRKLENDCQQHFTIMLTHQPTELKTYSNLNVDLLFSGHAHGGQIRIPFIGGLYAPGQGLFPKFTAGVHRLSGTTLVISRGLGGRINTLRLFNRPEIVSVTLNSTTQNEIHMHDPKKAAPPVHGINGSAQRAGGPI